MGLVAGEQDPLAFLLAQAVGHMAATAFAAIHAFPIPANCRLRSLAGHQQQSLPQGSQGPSGDRPGSSVLPVLSPEGLDFFAAYRCAEACGYNNAAAMAYGPLGYAE